MFYILFYIQLFLLLYMIAKYAFYHNIRHMGVLRSISRPIHRGFQLREPFGQYTSIDVAFRLGHHLCDMVR